jgi:uncharacterized protein YjiS (DUF1127 family)
MLINYPPTLALRKTKDTIAALEERLSRWPAWWGHVTAIIRVWMSRSRSRRRLGELDDHELADIGVSRGQARFESEKPFWRP